MMPTSDKSENISYLVPREPSIKCWNDRVKLDDESLKSLVQLGQDIMDTKDTNTISSKINVFLRLKPCQTPSNVYSVVDCKTLQTEAPKKSVSYKNVTNGMGKLIHRFTFTSVLDSDTNQQMVFDQCVTEQLKQFVFGKNFLLMAHGTTSAGKTFTMQGSVEQPGIIPRALDMLFKSLRGRLESGHLYQPHFSKSLAQLSMDDVRRQAAHKNMILRFDCAKGPRPQKHFMDTLSSDVSSLGSEPYSNSTFREMQSRLSKEEWSDGGKERLMVWISMVEIYNEQVYDLLEVPGGTDSVPPTGLSYGDDEGGGTYIKNLRYLNVTSGDEAFQVLEFGRSNLHFAPTKLNRRSSRSHCISIITLARFIDFENGPHAIISKFSFCDLAGSERAKKTLNVGDRLAESKYINKSLQILGSCLQIIRNNQTTKVSKIVPYRESKLTRLFRLAMTGQECFSLIVNVTADPHLFDETMNVLKFSAIAQQIETQSVFVEPKRIKSRFSRLLMESRELEHALPPTRASTDSVAYIQLLAVHDKVKEELVEEKARVKRIEAETRQEVCKAYQELLDEVNEESRVRLEGEASRLEDNYTRKWKMMVASYEKELRKENKEVEILERKVQNLEEENLSLRTQTHELLEQHETDMSELVEARRLLSVEKRTTHAFEQGQEAAVTELQQQLSEANATIEDFRNLLEEAAEENAEANECIESLKNVCEYYYEKLEEQKKQCTELTDELDQRNKQYDGLVDELDQRNKQYDGLVDELDQKNKQYDGLVDELDQKNKQYDDLANESTQRTEQCDVPAYEFDEIHKQRDGLTNELTKETKQYEYFPETRQQTLCTLQRLQQAQNDEINLTEKLDLCEAMRNLRTCAKRNVKRAPSPSGMPRSSPMPEKVVDTPTATTKTDITGHCELTLVPNVKDVKRDTNGMSLSRKEEVRHVRQATTYTPEMLAREISKFSEKDSKPNEIVHPSAKTNRGTNKKTKKKDNRRDKEEQDTKMENPRQLFIENDFDAIEDLDCSLRDEPIASRLCRRRK